MTVSPQRLAFVCCNTKSDTDSCVKREKSEPERNDEALHAFLAMHIWL